MFKSKVAFWSNTSVFPHKSCEIPVSLYNAIYMKSTTTCLMIGNGHPFSWNKLVAVNQFSCCLNVLLKACNNIMQWALFWLILTTHRHFMYIITVILTFYVLIRYAMWMVDCIQFLREHLHKRNIANEQFWIK